MKIKYYFLTFLLIIFSCSNDSEVEQDINELILNIVSFDNSRVTFNYILDENFDIAKLIWGLTNDINENNYIDSKDLNLSNSEVLVEELNSNTNYYFRIIGYLNNQVYYSEVVELTTSEPNFSLIIDTGIYSSTINNWVVNINEIVQLADGYIIISEEMGIYGNNERTIIVSKYDLNFNLVWTKLLNENPNGFERFYGLLYLGNESYIGIAGKGNSTNREVYGFKFDSNGTFEDIKYYNSPLNDGNSYLDTPYLFENKSGNLKVLLSADSTYYNTSDRYVREIWLNNDGDVVNDNIIANINHLDLIYLKFDNYGNMYNYGLKDVIPNDGLITYNALLEKYDIYNNLIWFKDYGFYGGDDSSDNILIEDNFIIIIGKNGHQSGFDGQSKWIIQTDNEGDIIWDFKETRTGFIYHGKDIIKGFEEKYLALFRDTYSPSFPIYTIWSLIKFDASGNILWKYVADNDINNDFISFKIVQNTLNTYTIFGIKDDNKIWVKQLLVED